MLMSQNNVSFRPILRNMQNHKDYGLCYKCLNYKELSDFAPVRDYDSLYDNPNSEHERIDWFKAFKTYQPSCLNLLNTTDDELAEAWGITVSDIRYALNTDRLRINSSRNYMYINSHPWEEQSYCSDCRNYRCQKSPVMESESDPTSVYVDYVQMLDGLLSMSLPNIINENNRLINSGFKWVMNCCGCKEDKSREEFIEDDRFKYGVRPLCIKCTRNNNRNRMANKKGAVGKYTAKEWEFRKAEFNYQCAYCGIFCGDNPTRDHFIPIKLGGTNYINNIIPSCHHCNTCKGKMFPYTWILQRFGKSHPMLKYRV